ncbi:spermatogenesis-associated protein 33 [Callorhinus ursinus]|uniref:Spermatogenesis-associated protein 33 n=1 Tax=Callorhinus ursinus TaxID=34884 RepID=A0A3Q7PJY8_CALUR|nr:spermatogenesis-associated protein 33 [Callorhinus ursinus]
MGLSKSKHKSRKGEEKKKGRRSSPAKTKERSMDRRSRETERPPDTKAAESFQGKKGAAKRQWPPSSEVEEKPDVKVKASKKKAAIPQIIITRASKETLASYSSIGSEEQRIIKEQVEWGPYSRHRNPSTVDAYGLRE